MATPAVASDALDQRRLLKVLSDYRRGNFSVRMPADRTGMSGKICDALNDAIERNEKLVRELERLSNVVGKAGNIRQRASIPHAEGGWVTALEAVNTLVSDLVQPTTEVALALQHVGELGKVGLQRVLLGVALRRQTEVVDHGVELVLQLRHLA